MSIDWFLVLISSLVNFVFSSNTFLWQNVHASVLNLFFKSSFIEVKLIYNKFHLKYTIWKFLSYMWQWGWWAPFNQISRSVVSDTLRPPGLQHTRLPCPSPTPRACSNSCPLSRWRHPTISSSSPLLFLPQSFPASGSFQVSHLFASGGQSIGVSASASVLPMNTQGWSPFGWTGWISLQSKRLWRVFSNNTVQKHQFFGAQVSL